MDDELKRKIAATLDGPNDRAADPAVVNALAQDPQAKEFAKGLRTVETALRNWPTRTRSAAQWEDFASAIEKKLGETPWETSSTETGAIAALAWDALDRPPLRDESDSGNESEHKRMDQPNDDAKDDDKADKANANAQHDDDDLEGLAALTKTSIAPGRMSIPSPPVKAGPSIVDDPMDESSGIVDIKQLAAVALAQQEAPPSSAAKADDAKLSATKAASETAAVAKTGATAEKKAKTAVSEPKTAVPAPVVVAKKTSSIVWIAPLLAAAAGGAFYFGKGSLFKDETTTAVESTRTEQGSTGAPANAPAPAAEAPAPVAPPVVAGDRPEFAAAAPPAQPPTITAEPSAGVTAAVGPARDQPAGTRERATTDTSVRGPHDEQAHARPSSSNDGTQTAHMRTAAPATTTTTTAAPAPSAEVAPAPAPAPAHNSAGASSNTAPAGSSSGHAGSGGGQARSIDDLMQQAVGPGGHDHAAAAAPAAAPAPATGELPERPSRSQITSALSPLSSSVRACTQGQTGTATVAMMIRNDGSVISASVSGPFTPEATSCIQGVVRRAHFPEFSRPSVPIVYPFSIQPPRPGGPQ